MNLNLDLDAAPAPTSSQKPLDGEHLASPTVSLDRGLLTGSMKDKGGEGEALPPGSKLDAANDQLSQDDAASTAAGAPLGSELEPEVTMRDLFGAFFEIDKPEAPAPNPLLVDTRGILKIMFGPCVGEDDIIFGDPEDRLREVMQQNKDLRIFDGLVELFGENGARVLSEEKPEGFHLLYASVPEASPLSGSDEVWLVEMPKMASNRQILHADPQPFFPSHCHYLESHSRMLYTPSNLIRWAHHKGQQLYMSNTRIVRWSDHSITLHVGSDVHLLLPAKGNAPVSLLGNASFVSKGGVALPTVTTTLYPNQHFVVESSEAASIERAVLAASARRDAMAHRRLLPYTMTILPEVDWSKPKSRNPLEEFVMMQYEQRQKELDRRVKEGRPMTLKEQLDREQELLNQLQSTNVDALLSQKQETLRQAAIQAGAKSSHPHGANHGRLERNLGLLSEGADTNHEAYVAREEEESSGETEEQEEVDDFEAMLNNMRKKRERKDQDTVEERRRGAERHEQEVFERFVPLLTALEELAQKLPMGTDAYGSVDGTVEFIRSGVFAPSIVEKEVPAMLQEVAEELPSIDTTAVRDAFLKIYANIQL